jgi:hypothetical protein
MKQKLGKGIFLVALALLAGVLAACPLGRGSKKIGEKCAANNDCAGARCEALVCTTSCQSDTDCAAATVKMACKGNEKSATNPEGRGACAVTP